MKINKILIIPLLCLSLVSCGEKNKPNDSTSLNSSISSNSINSSISSSNINKPIVSTDEATILNYCKILDATIDKEYKYYGDRSFVFESLTSKKIIDHKLDNETLDDIEELNENSSLSLNFDVSNNRYDKIEKSSYLSNTLTNSQSEEKTVFDYNDSTYLYQGITYPESSVDYEKIKKVSNDHNEQDDDFWVNNYDQFQLIFEGIFFSSSSEFPVDEITTEKYSNIIEDFYIDYLGDSLTTEIKAIKDNDIYTIEVHKYNEESYYFPLFDDNNKINKVEINYSIKFTENEVLSFNNKLDLNLDPGENELLSNESFKYHCVATHNINMTHTSKENLKITKDLNSYVDEKEQENPIEEIVGHIYYFIDLENLNNSEVTSVQVYDYLPTKNGEKLPEDVFNLKENNVNHVSFDCICNDKPLSECVSKSYDLLVDLTPKFQEDYSLIISVDSLGRMSFEEIDVSKQTTLKLKDGNKTINGNEDNSNTLNLVSNKIYYIEYHK